MLVMKGKCGRFRPLVLLLALSLLDPTCCEVMWEVCCNWLSMGPTELEIRGVNVAAEGAGNLPASLPGAPCWSKPIGRGGVVIAP